MIHRLQCACLGAVLVGALTQSGRVAAKPPDLPMNETNRVTPVVTPEGEFVVQPPQTAPAPPRAHPLLAEIRIEVSDANSGSLIFGVGVNSNSGLTGSIVVNERNFDVKLANVVQCLVEELLPPAESLYEILPNAIPTPTLYQLRPTARRSLVGSMLFGLHPLMSLLPTDKALDAPHDHPRHVAGDDVLSDLPPVPKAPKERPIRYRGGFCGVVYADDNFENDWWKWVMRHWAARHPSPSLPQNEGYLAGSLVASAAEIDAPLVPGAEALPMPQEDKPHKKKHKNHRHKAECLPMPREEASSDGLTCPYLRQQMMDRHACQMADPQIGGDVLDNLERLKKADGLVELAEELARGGCIAEALACCARVESLCPGSPCAERAAGVMLDVCLGIHEPKAGMEEAAEVKTHPDTDSSDKEPGVEQQVRGLMKACRLLMNEGLHHQAAELARQAYALDPESVMADPLVYKMHLLAETSGQQSSGASHQADGSEASEPPSCPYCPRPAKPIREIVPEKKTETGPTTLLVPPMPPVDYEVVPALDRVLTEGAEEASEVVDAPSSVVESIDRILGGSLLGFGMNSDGSLRLCGEYSCGGTVYHALFSKGCLALWKTPDAKKLKP